MIITRRHTTKMHHYQLLCALGGTCQDIGCEGAMAAIMNIPQSLEFLNWQLSGTSAYNILMRSLFFTLQSVEMIDQMQVLAILHISICIPTRWLAENVKNRRMWTLMCLTWGILLTWWHLLFNLSPWMALSYSIKNSWWTSSSPLFLGLVLLLIICNSSLKRRNHMLLDHRTITTSGCLLVSCMLNCSIWLWTISIKLLLLQMHSLLSSEIQEKGLYIVCQVLMVLEVWQWFRRRSESYSWYGSINKHFRDCACNLYCWSEGGWNNLYWQCYSGGTDLSKQWFWDRSSILGQWKERW